MFVSTLADGNNDIHDEEDEIKHSMLATINKDQTSREEAMSPLESDHWRKAIKEELK